MSTRGEFIPAHLFRKERKAKIGKSLAIPTRNFYLLVTLIAKNVVSSLEPSLHRPKLSPQPAGRKAKLTGNN
jgi:hypothetical protein